MCNQRLWQLLIPLLPDHLALVHVEIPKGGSIDDIATQLIDNLPQHPCYLLGFSLGGYLAAYIACHYPERIKSLFIVSNTPTQLPEHELLLRAQTLAWLEENHYQGLTTIKAKNLLDKSSDQSALITSLQLMDKELGAETLYWQIKATTVRSDLLSPLAHNQTSVSFYYSEQDPLINNHWLKKAAAYKNFSLYRGLGTGHMLPLEQPKQLAKHITTWVI